MPLILRYGEEADGFLIFLLIYEERFVPFHPIFYLYSQNDGERLLFCKI